jgi:PilZ domain
LGENVTKMIKAEVATVSTTRKGDRISISISVQISCADLTGKHFTEVVQTVNVSRNGCCLLLKQSLSIGQKIHLQRIGSREDAVGRVVGQTGICAEGNLYGIEVLNPDENFWGIRFPHQKELEEGSVRVLLKCSACQNCEEAALNEVDLSVFQITHRLTRKCQACSANTVWEPVPHKTEVGAAQNSKKPDKRKYARVSMKTVACIGPPGPQADVVDVVNVSRGGVCFCSSRTYREDTWVQVAVPYTLGSANIFVAGRIVRSRKMGNALTEYGVEYVKS